MDSLNLKNHMTLEMSDQSTKSSFDIKKFLMGSKYPEVSQLHKILLFRSCFMSKPSADEGTMLLTSISKSTLIKPVRFSFV